MRAQRDRLICFDLGDTLMIEESERKDADGVTLEADLIPGMAELIRDLSRLPVALALVADTRAGTYRNVLAQHGLFDMFDAFAVSEELGIEKPHPRMFAHALAHSGVDAANARAVMVGNNYGRDVLGARAAGFEAVWFHWNTRYPAPPEPAQADGVVTSADELRAWLDAWLSADGTFHGLGEQA